MIIEQLSSLVDDAAALEAWSLTGAEVREVAKAVQRTRTALDAVMSELAGCADGMGLPKEDGATSTTAWLADLTGMTKSEASDLVRMAKLSSVTTAGTRAAWAAGQISTAQASVIMKAIDTLPDWVDDEPRRAAEAHLIQLAGEHNLDDLKRFANRIIEVIDPDGADEMLGEQVRREEEKAWEATRLSMKRSGDGTTRGAFTIPDTDADTLRAAIEGIIAPRRANLNAASLGMDVNDFNALPRDQKMGHAFIELSATCPPKRSPKPAGWQRRSP